MITEYLIRSYCILLETRPVTLSMFYIIASNQTEIERSDAMIACQKLDGCGRKTSLRS